MNCGRWGVRTFPAAFVFSLKRILALAFPAGVCDREGPSGRVIEVPLGLARSTESLGRFRGWPSAVFSLLPFAVPPRQMGGCQGLRSNPKGLALMP
jgi:hypothetical protein